MLSFHDHCFQLNYVPRLNKLKNDTVFQDDPKAGRTHQFKMNALEDWGRRKFSFLSLLAKCGNSGTDGNCQKLSSSV